MRPHVKHEGAALRKYLSLIVPAVLAASGLGVAVRAQTAGDAEGTSQGSPQCASAVAGSGTGTAVQQSPRDAAIAVFPNLAATLPAESTLEDVTRFEFQDGGFITVVQQANGRYIVEGWVLCIAQLPFP